jgi:hypothetical protein
MHKWVCPKIVPQIHLIINVPIKCPIKFGYKPNFQIELHNFQDYGIYPDSYTHYIIIIWRFPKIGVPQMDLQWKIHPYHKWMIWGYPYFRKLLYIDLYI